MKTIKIFAIIAIAIIGFAFTGIQKKQPAPWKIPAEYKTMKNPLANDKASVNKGKMIFMKHCRSCHGNTGIGNGPKAARLKTFPGDFSSTKFTFTDGELLFITLNGRDEMPNYKTKIPGKKDQWSLVNYLKSLKK
ncbi:c-type cytochrome [Ancylomarina longa]|uniref:Cytochrome c n=1 Tax=Ancylomarina longa TaxID=2487017 RepID=A0A434AZ87_9BACT|nr:c-type cytochrome [Ancylomarina longa]RUT79910.1 cytochrome c [Ancylomarina longa]